MQVRRKIGGYIDTTVYTAECLTRETANWI